MYDFIVYNIVDINTPTEENQIYPVFVCVNESLFLRRDIEVNL